MKVLVVSSGNGDNFQFEKHQAFIYDQIKSIKAGDSSIEIDIFFVKGKGIKGYFQNIPILKRKIKSFKPDILHAHGGHVGFICVFQRLVPVITTFHGSDINNKSTRFISYIAALFSRFAIFVSSKLLNKVPLKSKKFCIIPCGVDRSIFTFMDKNTAKKKLNLSLEKHYFLFTSSFTNAVKNYPFAEEVMRSFPEYTLLEIKNRSREEVALLLNATDLLLMTSFSEGSPQITKEALACGQRIVSINVGDVKEQCLGVDNCRILNEYDTSLFIKNIREVLERPIMFKNSNLIKYDSVVIANKIINLYKTVKDENSKM